MFKSDSDHLSCFGLGKFSKTVLFDPEKCLSLSRSFGRNSGLTLPMEILR